MVFGHFLTSIICASAGFIYPAYRHYKFLNLPASHTLSLVETEDSTDELVLASRCHMDQAVFWNQYWITMAFFSAVECVADYLIYWLPFYYEIKILTVLWLSLPFTQGTTVVYTIYLVPFLTKNERIIDKKLHMAEGMVMDFLYARGEAARTGLTGFLRTLVALETTKQLISKSVSTEDLAETTEGEASATTVMSPKSLEARKARRKRREEKARSSVIPVPPASEGERGEAVFASGLPAMFKARLEGLKPGKGHARSASGPVMAKPEANSGMGGRGLNPL